MASKMVYVNDLVTVDLIAKRKKMSVGQVTNLIKGKTARKQHFPQPLVGWGCRGVWLWSDVDVWFKEKETQQRKKIEKQKAKQQSL
jgi:hypothetical protein